MPKPTRKPYRTPKLHAYGNVKQITQAKPSGPNTDNASGDSNKTGLSVDQD